MDVQMPDGTIVTGVPDNITQTELLARFNKYNAPDTPVTMKEAALGGVKRMLGSSETAVSGLFGAEEAAKEGLARQEGITERSGASLDKVKAAYEKGLWPAVKEVASQIPTAIAEQSPQLAATIGSARLGAMAGSPFGPWGAGAGALLGAAIPSYFQQAGSNLERQAQEGKPVSGAAAYSAAVPQAALDVFTDRLLFSRLMGVPVKALGTAEAEALAKQSLLTTLRKGTVKGIAAEVPPEVTQQMLERLQAGLPLTDDAARKEYLDTAYQVALLGPLGAIGSVQERGEAKDVVAQQQQQAQEEAARAQRQATGVMEQQPLFDANQAPIPPIAEPTLTPPEAPISTIAPEEAPVEQPVPAGQGDLFTRRGTPTKDALASVEAARVQGIPAQVEQLKTTPEGRAELSANMKAYYPDLSVKERNVERLNLQRMNVVPVVAPEGTLTPEILKSVGIVPNNRTATPIYNALVGTHITNPTTYNLLATLADTPSKSDIGIKANTLLDKFQHFNPNAVQSDLFPGERNAPEAQIQTAEPVQATQATEPVQADLFGVSEDGVRDNTEQQGVEPSLDVPVSPAPTEIKETPKSKRGRVDVPVAIPEPDNGAVAVGTAVQPSALAPVPKGEAKKAAQALKKMPLVKLWDDFETGIVFGKLSKIGKDRVRDAVAGNFLTQDLADEIARIEAGNARAEAANAVVKPETPLDEAPVKEASMVSPDKTTAFINDFFANTSQHAFSNKTRIVNNQAAVEISPQEGQIHIHDIQSFAPASFGEQGTGGGRKALRLLTDLADKHGVELNLTSQAYSEKGLSDDQLHSWYARNGFKDDEYGGMVRKPKTNINPAAAIRDKSSYQEYLESKRADLQALIDELSPPISKEAALHELKVAIAKWKKRAESGAEGRYGEGEIDQTIESFNQDPLAYAEIIPLSKKVVAALNKYDRTIEHALDELSNIDTEIEIAKSIHRQIVNGDYHVAINNLVKLGELDEKYKPFYTAIHTGNTRHALTFIEKNLHNKGDKILAKLLNQSNTLPRVRFAYTGSDSAIGTYEAVYDRVDIDAGYYLQDNINVSSMAKTLLHEVMHSATVNKLSKAMYITKMGTIGFATVNKKVRTPGWKEYQFTVNAPDGSVMTDFSKNEESFAKLVNERYGAPIMIDKEVREYLASDEYATANNIIEVFDWLSANHPKVFHPAMHYGATNPLEMMAEIFVNPTFYKAMTDITLPAHLVSKHPVKALHWFIRAIKRLIGLDAAPDSAIVTIMSDTLALTDRRVLGKHVLESTRTEEIGRRIHYDKYKGSNVTAQINPQAQALAQQTITNMAGPSLHANTALPRSTPTQIAQQIATTMTTNPTGAFGMIEDIVNKVRTKAIDKAATLAATIQDQNDGAFRDVNGQMRADLLLSAANNMRNYVTSFYAEGGIELGASGEIRTVPSQHRMDGVYLAAQPLYARLGNTMAGKLVNDAFFYYRAKAFKALPQADWPENWIKDPSLVPTDTQINTALNAFNQFPELEAMRQQFIGTKNNLVKFLRQVGFLSAEKERAFLADDSYAPWIRIKDYTDKASGLGNIGRMVDLRQLKAVVGGSEEVNDMLENMAQFLAWGVRSGIANHSANAALKTMKTMNIATQYPGRPSNVDSSHTVMTYENGKPTFWQVDNPWHLAAFQTVKGMNSIMLGHIGRALGTLRAGIVLFPAFPVRQIVMDSQRAFMEAGVEHPWRMMGKIWGGIADAYKGTHADVVNLRRHGVTSEVDFNIHDTPHGRAADFGLGEHGKTITDRWVHSPAYKFLHALAYTADMAVRLGIYRQTMEETGDVALATTRAREIINFQKSGTSELLHTLKGTIPFLGAFLQGTDVNYRSMVGRGNSMKARKAAAAAYWTNMAMYSGLVIAYTMMMSGDDDYEEQKGFITDRNFLIPGGGLLPVPPDVGFLAKVVPERITDYILQNGTDNPESAARLRQGLLQAMATGFLPPAAVYGVTPAVELMLNKSFFSDLPIVGQRYQGLQADQQYTPSTSELAKTVGSITGQSPLQIDYIFNAIGGTSAGAILQLADVIGGSNKMASDKLPLVGSFQQKTVGGRYAEEYYAVRELVDKAYNTAVAIQMEGDQAKLEAYLAQPKIQERLQAYTGIESIHAALNEVSHQRNMIANDPSLSPQEKRDATNTLMAQVEAGLKDMGIRKLRSEIE